jgi:hypothetical protein
MKKNSVMNLTFLLTIVLLFSSNIEICAQQIPQNKTKSDFWNHVHFGGGLGLSFSGNGTDISIAPSAIYVFNNYFAAGPSLIYNYSEWDNNYSSHMYGGSIIGLFNPINEIQLSAELEQLRVNIDYSNPGYADEDVWNTGLFLGAGYRTNNVTIGMRYNVLFNDKNSIYTDAYMPFLRVYF